MVGCRLFPLGLMFNKSFLTAGEAYQVCPSPYGAFYGLYSAQYVGGSDRTVPFSSAPSAVMSALKLIKERLEQTIDLSIDFNEVLTAAYMERQKMAVRETTPALLEWWTECLHDLYSCSFTVMMKRD
jgi:hypothetical protein